MLLFLPPPLCPPPPLLSVVLPQISVWRINHLQPCVSAVLECCILFVICSGPSVRLLISAAQRDMVNWGGSMPLFCGPGPHSFSSLETACTPMLITWLVEVEEVVGCGTWTLYSCRHQLSFCGKGIRAIETLLERKKKDGCASSLFSEV